MSPAEEKILVVPREKIYPLLEQPFCRGGLDAALACVERHHEFRPRATVEEDESYQQIIPYVLCRRADQYLAYRRTGQTDEARLREKVSLGFGGHVNDGDIPEGEQHIVEAGMQRELNEEIHLGGNCTLGFAGIISDESTPVSRVHIGFVHIMDTDSDQFEVREPDMIEAWWAGPNDLRELYPRMESWSQIVFDHIIAL